MDNEQQDKPALRQGPDGLSEYDRPMPASLVAVWIGLIIWSLGYLVIFPGLGINLTGWTQESDMPAAPAKAAASDSSGDLLAAALKDPKAAEEGKALFASNCAACHGAEGKGQIGPNLCDATWVYGDKPEAMGKTIREGTAKGMPPFESLGEKKVAQLVAFLRSLQAPKGGSH